MVCLQHLLIEFCADASDDAKSDYSEFRCRKKCCGDVRAGKRCAHQAYVGDGREHDGMHRSVPRHVVLLVMVMGLITPPESELTQQVEGSGCRSTA